MENSVDLRTRIMGLAQDETNWIQIGKQVFGAVIGGRFVSKTYTVHNADEEYTPEEQLACAELVYQNKLAKNAENAKVHAKKVKKAGKE
jgi:hypothetical protein